MAGSYEMVLSGYSLIKNMGDAYEAIEEMLWLIQKEIGTVKAKGLLDKFFYPMERGEIEEDKIYKYIKKLMEE